MSRPGGWCLVFTTKGRAMVEFDGRGKIFKADGHLKWANGRNIDKLKEYLAKKDQLKNWELFGNGK